ncbi:hypothetical protein AB6T38_16575 [Aliiglaciecola sp. SL4]|uniref:hypothetical protein n=1 Tax=Aliiglaciecola sp. SL4 TaxID=3239806 RepID=UPI00355B2DB0
MILSTPGAKAPAYKETMEKPQDKSAHGKPQEHPPVAWALAHGKTTRQIDPWKTTRKSLPQHGL